MEITPPSEIWGHKATSDPGAIPKVVAEVEFRGNEGEECKVHLFRWERSNFRVDGLADSDGWFMTIGLEMNGHQCHLVQNGSIFYAEVSGGKIGTKAARDIKRAGVEKPQWKRRSDRWWPTVLGEPLRFIGQFEVQDMVFYVFLQKSPEFVVAIYKDYFDVQDVEDHYAEEEKRLRKK